MRWTRERVGYLVVGLAFGALVDGVVLHQILQWHHLWSARTPDTTLGGLEDNTLADGVFHLCALAVLALGLALLVGTRLLARSLVGLGLVGWGLFHLVDQAVFHVALGAHHIRQGVGDDEVYDWTFVGIGLAFMALGSLIARSPSSREVLAS